MGNYNPRAPYILGEEWVPIRDEVVQFSPAVNAAEVGHMFTLLTARQVGTGRFYVQTPPPADAASQELAMAVYPHGYADRSGPIRSVIIPVSAAIVSGAGFNLSNANTQAEALYNPADNKSVTYLTQNSAIDSPMRLFFATNQYQLELYNKRILGVNFLYNGSRVVSSTSTDPDPLNPYIQVNRIGAGSTLFDSLDLGDVGSGSPLFSSNPIQRQGLGEMTMHFSQTASTNNTRERMPWTFPVLQLFEPANATPLNVAVTFPNSLTGASATYALGYAALEVIYCEEQRLIVGGSMYSGGQAGTFDVSVLAEGVNVLTMRDFAYNANPILAAGTYDLVIWSPDPGDVNSGLAKDATYSQQNALRELYQIPPHPGLQVNIPFPTFDNIGATLTAVDTAVLPQLSLHATGSGATLTEPHAYGRQGAAQVYGANTATQEIYDDIVGVNTVYPQVRFYARRFGDTTIPLALTGTASLAASTVSISVSEFDMLTEIVDGWKEITLRFATAPTMGTLATPEPSWAWSATGEGSGNRWEILAACAPAISGLPGNMLQQAPAATRLGTATYQPTAGDTVELTWMPQGVASPWVSGASADPGCDAVLIFSQDPPTVTGVALTALTQTVTGIGLDCGSQPCCIPSGIAYQRITWSPVSFAATGVFGGYELQRFDTTPGASFQTIMLASSIGVTGFNDYEARVGLTSVYRIRALNVLNFAGAWSTYVSGAPPSPGVSGAGGCSQTGALIFTSNAAQSGIYNAAYIMQWEREPVEDFRLPEADMVRFQPMYQRDGMVAFHGTERGLEQFTRTLLIQAGAIDPIRLADVKTLRDLAWASLPYVCVRDELGDRWFANVRVPTVNARNNRTKYLGQVQVTEVTTTPYAVDPS